MTNINVELYDFLKKCETHLYKRGNILEAVVLVDFADVPKFQKTLGSDYFSDGDVIAVVHDGYLGFDLKLIMENIGHSLYDYRYCFPEDEVEMYSYELNN